MLQRYDDAALTDNSRIHLALLWSTPRTADWVVCSHRSAVVDASTVPKIPDATFLDGL